MFFHFPSEFSMPWQHVCWPLEEGTPFCRTFWSDCCASFSDALLCEKHKTNKQNISAFLSDPGIAQQPSRWLLGCVFVFSLPYSVRQLWGVAETLWRVSAGSNVIWVRPAQCHLFHPKSLKVTSEVNTYTNSDIVDYLHIKSWSIFSATLVVFFAFS